MSSPAPAARAHLLRALHADLVGPFSLDPASEEVLPLPPSRWYLTGFLAPEGARDQADAEAEEELAAGNLEEADEPTAEEPAPKQKRWYPASIGLSVLLPAGTENDTVRATVSCARYVRDEIEVDASTALPERAGTAEPAPEEDEAKPRRRVVWKRLPERRLEVEVPLDPARLQAGMPLPGEPGVELAGRLEGTSGPGLPAGTRALALFVVNRQESGAKDRKDEAFLFQVGLELAFEAGFVARPDPRGGAGDDWDERVADLQYRDRHEYAVGHGTSVEAPAAGERHVTRVRTTWLPTAEVRLVKPGVAEGVVTSMEELGELEDGAAVRTALASLPAAYREWIGRERAADPGNAQRRDTLAELMDQAERACARIEDGIELLATDDRALRAFTLANQAMAMAALRRSPERYGNSPGGARPEWRLFQLAFVLLNLRGIAFGTHADRETVEMIFFPTGGGKTEAYLGVIAFTLIHRRLEGGERPDAGLGVAVMLRYTLRLLTLDQLGRAATLVCALEMLRRRHRELGDQRFAVGLWVGKTATANTMKQVRRKITDYKNQGKPSPFPLTDCPWCRAPITPDSLELAPSAQRAERVVAACSSFRCDFARAKNRDGLPVVFVDEQVYRELPSFLVGTVDKFAMLPWRGETGKLFGRALWHDGGRFYGPTDGKVPGAAQALPEGLRPPELIVQDELHLIAGPLGTMVGLYETAIEELCLHRTDDGEVVRPKILASTATARRAREQVRALFGRRQHAVFPPPGADDAETFFSTVDGETPGRLYLGVAATGQSMKRVLLRTYNALLAAANRLYEANGPASQPVDGYMSLVGYFNSLRELGGLRRLVEDEVRTRVHLAETRRPLDLFGQSSGAEHPWFRNRTIQAEPVELTSREHTSTIAEAKRRLGLPYAEKQHVDVCLASNMISVGVDIDRLGLMVVAGQPKTTAEYIQASSRVGRQAAWPGLVVTCFNVHKPRDRSHYERFASYHQSFYRWVEAASLTPFSGPALDRGLAGTLVAMARLLDPEMTPAAGAMQIHARRAHAEEALARLAARGADHDGAADAVQKERRAKLVARGRDLLDAWETVVATATKKAAAAVSYSPYDLDSAAGKPLLFTALAEDQPEPGSPRAKFKAPTSMRDVEPSVHLWLQRRRLGASP